MNRLNRTSMYQDTHPLSDTQFHLRNQSFQFGSQGYSKSQQNRRIQTNNNYQQSIPNSKSNNAQRKKHFSINYDQTFRNLNNTTNGISAIQIERDKQNSFIKDCKDSKERHFSQHKNSQSLIIEDPQNIDRRLKNACGFMSAMNSVKNGKNSIKSRLIQLDQYGSFQGGSSQFRKNAQQSDINISQQLQKSIKNKNKRFKNSKREKQNFFEEISINYEQDKKMFFKRERLKNNAIGRDRYVQVGKPQNNVSKEIQQSQVDRRIPKQILKILQKNLIPFFVDQMNELQLRLTRSMEKQQQRYSKKLQWYSVKLQQNNSLIKSCTDSIQIYQKENKNLRDLVALAQVSIENMNEQRENQKRRAHELQQKLMIEHEHLIENRLINQKRVKTQEQSQQVIVNEGFLETLEQKIQQILHSNRLEAESFQNAVYSQTSQLQESIEGLRAQLQVLKKKVNKRLNDFRIQHIQLKGQIQQKLQSNKKLGANNSFGQIAGQQENRIKYSQHKFSKIQKIVKVYNQNFLQITKRLEFLQANISQSSSARKTIEAVD